MSLEYTITKYPIDGPLEIKSYEQYLSESKEEYYDIWNRHLVYSENISDFAIIRELGRGAFGKVSLIRDTSTSKNFAMKAMEKRKIIQSKRLQNVKYEKMVLQSNNSPQTIFLESYINDEDQVYFVTPFVCGGDLYHHLVQMEEFNETTARFYTAQVILGLEYLHNVNIIYRDIKPENILIDHTGYIKLADFGFAKPLKKDRTYTFCGTSEYVAPEVILGTGYGFASEWWSLGIFAFEMNCGHTPFYNSDTMKMFSKICKGKYKIPSHFSSNLEDLVTELLQVKLSKRLGNLKGGVSDIKNHNWLKVVNWMALLCRKMTAPYFPDCPIAKEIDKRTGPSVYVRKQKDGSSKADMFDF